MQFTRFKRAGSTAGTAFIGLGTFIFYGNLYRDAVQLFHRFEVARQTWGAAATFGLAASQILQDYADDRRLFLHIFLRNIVVTTWPLLLVIAGMILLRVALRGPWQTPEKNLVRVSICLPPVRRLNRG